MNKITKLVNYINDLFDPLHHLATDENFRGELLASVGAKEKTSAADKAKTKEKLTGLVKKLDDLKKFLGLDKSDIPNVDNLKALAAVLQECWLVYQVLREMLESCDFDDSSNDADGKQIKVFNAISAISGLLTHLVLKKKAPAIAAYAEGLNILSDEYNEIKRAFYLITTIDALRPTGDLGNDLQQRIAKAIFLDGSVLVNLLDMIVESIPFEEIGLFMFNHGWELPPEKDNFKNANRIANRVLQLQYVPGTFLADKTSGKLDDLLISFVTIPVMPPGNTDPNAEPLGFQYVLRFESKLGELFPGNSDVLNGFKMALANTHSNITGSPAINMMWGHETEFKIFGDKGEITELLDISIPKPTTETPESSARGAETPEDTANAESNGMQQGDIALKLQLIKTDGKDDLDMRLDFSDFSLSISGDGRDGFIQKILPDGDLKVDLNFTLGFTPRGGFHVEGLDAQDGLFFHFKVDKTLFGALTIPTAYVGLLPSFIKDAAGKDELNGIKLESSAMLQVDLGPFHMTVDRLGLFLELGFPKDGSGNLGAANLDLGLKPPSSIGFLVNGGGVTGGGYLSLEPEKGQYFGAAELTIAESLSLKAVAVILTKKPDGSKGFSFLLIVSVEFSPAIELFMGIRLKGVGGLVAIHRSIDLDAFRAGIRDDRFDAILFPDNPVGNAPAIVQTMTTLFPFGENTYSFGLLGRLEWGSSKLVDMKVGLLIEIFNTNKPGDFKVKKFAIVGNVKMTVEKEEIKVLKFKLNFLVAFDFEQKMLSIDAALYDSVFGGLTVHGDFYLRLLWGNEPCFLVSVGGWHPDFQPPTLLRLPAKATRLGISLMNSDKIKLGLDIYVALTSNTFQFGAAVALKVHVSKFRLEAGLSLDALFRSLNDFYVNFEGKLLIFWGDSRLAGITVKGVLSGTAPWRIRGEATFSIWIWDYDVEFDVASGPETSELAQSVDILPLFDNAVRDTRNWRITLPEGKAMHSIQRDTEKDPPLVDNNLPKILLADPLARIEVTQQVTPLGIRIDKIGFEKANDFRFFELKTTDNALHLEEDGIVEDFFAPGMYLNLDDSEKLSRKSFEQMPAGLAFGGYQTLKSGVASQNEWDYEDKFIDSLAPTDNTVVPKAEVTKDRLAQWLSGNSINRSEQGRKNKQQKEITTRKATAVREEFVLADISTGKIIAEVGAQKSMTATYYEQWKLKKINPLRKTLVVRRSEVTA